MPASLDLEVRRCRRVLASENIQAPFKIRDIDLGSLFASDLGRITHLFRRFYGGGSYIFSQTYGAENYSKFSFARVQDLQAFTGCDFEC